MNLISINPAPPARRRNATKRSRLVKAMAAVAKDESPHQWQLDFDFLKELRESNVLEHIKEICRVVQLNENPDRAIRLPAVLSLLGISKSSWYSRLNLKSASYDPKAPQPIKLGKGANSTSAWWQSEVVAYLTSCAQARNTN